ncbi:SMP-30/gluconolactonase/LRE family protein [Roseomonas sp. CCTCC AB2023176]|uniref:SMP-30/gluconolactonase/LRE family protein n=1 Tax=Roseomonas sp. CCTCC AB2023176 TaxID=3342640 RepID=UPI0035E10AE4
MLPTPHAKVGESPVWDARAGVLWWVDIPAPALHRTNPATNETRTWPLPEACGSIALTRGDHIVLALRSGLHRFHPESGEVTFIVNPEPDRPMNRLNDGKVSPEGRFVVGSMNDQPDKTMTGGLHVLHPNGTAERLLDALIVSNGLAWGPDGRTVWHSDSRGGVIWIGDWDRRVGAVTNRRLVATVSEAQGRPDGAACDVEGGYWSAGVSAGVLNRWLPDGTLDRVVPLPVKWPTMPCFAGPGLRTCYVTSLIRDPTQAGPDDGRIVEVDLGVAGVPVARYAG